MSKEVFRNYNKKAIKDLMWEIGTERVRCAIKDAGMERPGSMEGFFLQYEIDTRDINLYFIYPSRVIFFLMPVTGFWRIPMKGWVKERIEED